MVEAGCEADCQGGSEEEGANIYNSSDTQESDGGALHFSYDTEAFQHKLKPFKPPFINPIPKIMSIYRTGLES